MAILIDSPRIEITRELKPIKEQFVGFSLKNMKIHVTPESELIGDSVLSYTLGNNANFKIPHDPVYVRQTLDGEQLVYQTSMMEKGKLYTVDWNGEKHVLMKTEDRVEFYKFIPK